MIRRIVPRRRAGIPEDSRAPYWLGERCEVIVQRRADERAASKPARSARGERRERSPNAQLKRLERALARRKTLAAQQRVRAQIDALKTQLEANA